MKLIIDSDINKYYVQMLCMIYYPGIKFGEDEAESSENPTLELKTERDDEGISANVDFRYMGKICSAQKRVTFAEGVAKDRTLKLVVGEAVLSALSDMTGYRPTWGMLTGVRPSKVAMEMLRSGMSKTRVKRHLTSDYLAIPKKSALATEVAINEMKIIGTPDPRDCSVYISIPFCPTKCAYCSFVSYSSKKLLSLIPEYLERLELEIKSVFSMISRFGLNLKTVYIGGGTPTILTAEQLERLLGTIHDLCDVSAIEEFTLEAGRPDTITAEKLAVAKRMGVGRISVNPQTLNDELLSSIGRAHTVDDFFRVYNIARDVGINCINTDLIAGLPGDRFKLFSESFDKILALRPENITMHTFCVKKSAELRQSDVFSRSGGDAGKCVDYSQIRSKQAGYKPYYMYRQKNTVGNYENVGMALEGYEGRYNIYMMEEVHSIFAAGAGAVTKLVKYDAQPGNKNIITRLFNAKYPYEYLADDRRELIESKAMQFYEEHVFGLK